MANVEQLNENLKHIWAFKALTSKEQNELIERCRPEAQTGKMENFKG